MTEQTNDTFNPELFLQTTISEANSTELILIPEGDYLAVSEPITVESFRSFDIKRGERAGQKGRSLDIKWNINDDSGQLKEYLGRAPSARQGIMLDTRPDGTLEMGKGKNVGLGRVREAVGQNANGQPWSFSMLGGVMAKIKVKHRVDGSKTYAEVVDVAKAG